jgi:methyl-accepting chemotaxis protein
VARVADVATETTTRSAEIRGAADALAGTAVELRTLVGRFRT